MSRRAVDRCGLAVLLLAAACASPGPAPSPAPVAPDECVGGELVSQGTEGPSEVSILLPEGSSRRLTIQESSELLALVGAEVRVCGRPLASGHMEVRHFQLIAIDGRPAHLGRLSVERGVYRLDLDDAPPVVVDVLPEGLRDAVGRRVWVQLNATSDGTVVRAYGILP